MSIELGKLLLDDETALAFAEWLHRLVLERRYALQKVADEKAKDEWDERCYEKLTAIASGIAARHGLLEDMDPWEQAKAACASWETQAGYFDVDEHFQMDADWREFWVDAYVDGLPERAKV